MTCVRQPPPSEFILVIVVTSASNIVVEKAIQTGFVVPHHVTQQTARLPRSKRIAHLPAR